MPSLLSRPRYFLPGLVALCLSVFLSACGDFTATPVPVGQPATTAVTPVTVAPAPPPTATVTPLRALSVLTAQELTSLPAPSSNAYLSPAGNAIAWVRQRDICIYTPEGQKQSCASIPSLIDFNSVRWSSTGRYLVFTENFYQTFNDPDIWLLEAATGKLTDLTDDHFNGRYTIGDPNPNSFLDLAPNWFDDGQQIIFLRYPGANDAIGPDIYTISVNGGAPVKRGELPSGVGRFAVTVITPSHDGKQLLYNVSTTDPREAINGLWLADLDGQHSRQIYKSGYPADTASNIPVVVDTAFDRSGLYYALLNQPGYSNSSSNWKESNSLLFNINEQPITPLDPQHGAQWLTWNPSGFLAYLVRPSGETGQAQAGLYLLDRPGGQSRLVYPGEFVAPFYQAQWRGLTWSAASTILLLNPKSNRYILVKLGVK